MKKAIALLLALVMVFALCACGGGDKGTADNGEKVVKIGVFERARQRRLRRRRQEGNARHAVCQPGDPDRRDWR